MEWVVYESGSRAGLSAVMFFKHYKKNHPNDDTLTLVDDDHTFQKSTIDTLCEDVEVSHPVYNEKLLSVCVFPADELTRQSNELPGAKMWFNKVDREYYDKRFINAMLSRNGVSVPLTLSAENIIAKPNSMSAGSKGICTFDDYCVQQRIDVEHEYVVDFFVDQDGKVVQLYPREVKLRAGYDKYIKFLPLSHKVARFTNDVVKADSIGLFRGVCHIQVIEDAQGKMYYVEGSKRISGSSLVNIIRGYDPFALLCGKTCNYIECDDDWHLFDELLIKAWSLIA